MGKKAVMTIVPAAVKVYSLPSISSAKDLVTTGLKTYNNLKSELTKALSNQEEKDLFDQIINFEQTDSKCKELRSAADQAFKEYLQSSIYSVAQKQCLEDADIPSIAKQVNSLIQMT